MASSLEIFDEDDFVSRFVVDQLVNQRASDGETQASRTQALLFAHERMLQRIALRVADGGVLEALETEPFARVGDAIQEHPPRAQAGDAHFPRRIEFATPLNRVAEQF